MPPTRKTAEEDVPFGKEALSDVSALAGCDRIFRLAVDAAPNGLLAVDRAGRIVLANAHIERLFGYTRAELLGQPVECLIPERLRGQHVGFREQFADEWQPRAMGAGRDLYGRKKNGDEVPVEIGLNPLSTGDGALVIVTVIDISERKQLERLRDDFLATLTHDIRGPVGNIAGLLEMVQEMEGLPGEAARLLGQMQGSVDSLFALVTNYLDSAKIEARELVVAREPFEMNEVVARVAAQYAADAARRGIALETGLDGRLVAMGDPLAMERVCTNLVRNALAFTPAGGRIMLRTGRAADGIRLVVADTGPGMAAEELPGLFERYRQTAAGRRKNGAGLGLFIVKSLVEVQGGRVEVESAPGVETRFTVVIPAADG